MNHPSNSQHSTSDVTDLLVVIPGAAIAVMVMVTLAGLIPHPAVSLSTISAVDYSLLPIACIALVCAIGAENTSVVTATSLATAGTVALSLWFLGASIDAWLSWDGSAHEWISSGHLLLRCISLIVAILAFLILMAPDGQLRVRRH